jgi:tetratricopeptide (TPR) repeat protein
MKRNNHLMIIVPVIVSLVLLCSGYSKSKMFAYEAEDRLQEGIKAFNQKKYREAYYILEPLAEKGEPIAQVLLGNFYLYGLGVSSNCHKACSWFEKAAKGGNSQAYAFLGDIYTFGKCGETDFKKAINYNLKGISLGNPLAANNLAWFYATVGYPGYQDPKMAIKYAQWAIRIVPYDGRYYDTLAAAYARDGQFKKAIETVRKAIILLRGMDSIPVTEKRKLEAQFINRLSLYMNGKSYIDISIRHR